MKQLIVRAKELQEQMVVDRRALHQMPEYGFALDQTVAYVKARLTEMDIACEKFRILLQEQIERAGKICSEREDFSTLKTVTIGLIDGDGIGPVLMKQAKRILETLLSEEIQNKTIILKQNLWIDN